MGMPSIEPSEVGATGLLWLLISYGYVLYYASGLISEGSELLLLVPSLAGLVGGVVLPLLGAVPDGAIMLFSGLGDVDQAQEDLAIGVGALAGSTIMLLTVPFALSVFAGRVDFSGPGEYPNYKSSRKLRDTSVFGALSTTGVALTEPINHGAKMMMLTTLPYFLIQIPAFFLSGDREEVSAGEHYWAAGGFVVCTAFFAYYMYSQVMMSNDAAHKLRRMATIKEKLKQGAVSLKGALKGQLEIMEKQRRNTLLGSLVSFDGYADEETKLSPKKGTAQDSETPSEEVKAMLSSILADAYHGYDEDRNNELSKKEFSLFLADFHETITPQQLDELFVKYDKSGDGVIDYDEFICACYVFIMSEDESACPDGTRGVDCNERDIAGNILSDRPSDGEEEEEEVPEDLSDLPEEVQQKVIKQRAFTMLIIGTTLVLLFSDPMVEVLSEVAERIQVPKFYVSFILAPLASNASEVLASQYYAAKKTTKTITVALTALEGAASMNNTFCLSIFMALIYFRGLAWQYTSETVAIILVQLIVGMWSLKDKMSSSSALLVFALFPLSILFVAIMEKMGFD